MKVSDLQMMKMRPMSQKSSREYIVHCPQCGNFLMVLSRGEAVIHCGVCGRDKKAIIRGGRVTVFELADPHETRNLPVAGNAGRR